jgi:hypothetical protein
MCCTHHLPPADKLSSGSMSTPDLGISDAGDKLSAADDAASKAKSVFGSGMSSALPANPLAAVADQNADVRDLATDYRDPAGAVQLDAASGESCMCCALCFVFSNHDAAIRQGICNHGL